MYCIRKVKEDIVWVGASDRRIALFENMYPVRDGMSYNSYVVLDEKTALLDTVDRAVSVQFGENLAEALGGKPLDYIIINHMEPDHCATLAEVIARYPEAQIVGNSKTLIMIKQFFNFDVDSRFITVKDGDTLTTGKHTFKFIFAPMVHWPEVMVTYDMTAKTLFSADAFGSFGAINGNLFVDEISDERNYIGEARRYYTNIVGQYGAQVAALLAKASAMDIEYICPLHGLIWRKNIQLIVDKYKKWSSYTPEDSEAVAIFYASVYGNTASVCDILAARLADLGVKNIVMYDVSNTNIATIIAETFRCANIVFASTTYNGKVFFNMATVLEDIKLHNIQNRTVGIIQNGTWAPTAARLIQEGLSTIKNTTFLEPIVTIKSALKAAELSEIDSLASAIILAIKNK